MSVNCKRMNFTFSSFDKRIMSSLVNFFAILNFLLKINHIDLIGMICEA
jgi:hypothetical protein